MGAPENERAQTVHPLGWDKKVSLITFPAELDLFFSLLVLSGGAPENERESSLFEREIFLFFSLFSIEIELNDIKFLSFVWLTYSQSKERKMVSSKTVVAMKNESQIIHKAEKG